MSTLVLIDTADWKVSEKLRREHEVRRSFVFSQVFLQYNMGKQQLHALHKSLHLQCCGHIRQLQTT